MIYDEDIFLPPADRSRVHNGEDTFPDTSISDVQSLVNEIAREQGGTESVFVDAVADEKGSGDGFDYQAREPWNVGDPQANQWYEDRIRAD